MDSIMKNEKHKPGKQIFNNDYVCTETSWTNTDV